MFHLIAWIQSRYYDHQYLKSLPDDYNDDGKYGPFIMDGKEYTIHIYGREDRIPQFHIMDMNGKDICSISLLKPKYIGKPNRYLNNKELKNLNEWISDEEIELKNKNSRWLSMCIFWESAVFNHSFKYDESMKPDYTLLEKEN